MRCSNSKRTAEGGASAHGCALGLRSTGRRAQARRGQTDRHKDAADINKQGANLATRWAAAVGRGEQQARHLKRQVERTTPTRRAGTRQLGATGESRPGSPGLDRAARRGRTW
ncbi:hypothetical protein VFPFJ_11528 [Purpureocillium lilacinum]|uniref:Uncharacterized protein n=1 Tax=Purpureocillium lilacinum TaxID=33203 RepID=A0A179F3Z7_PURLI|nr:hypothetical protein VFPFJ_11528 [Purpureocillium lilacinum]OAQ60090.1 hypothetical protein VFPFJ_11528 [Purpureocillium lilacinum]